MGRCLVPKMVPAWDVCDSCEDLVCSLHNEHVADCPCPPLEVWVDQGLDPYAPCVLKLVDGWE